MKLKNKFILLTAGLAAVFAALMVYDRVRTAKNEMLERAQERADYIASFITDISADQLERGSSAELKRTLKGFENFAQISYLRVADSGGRVIYRMGHPGINLNDRGRDADIFSSSDDIYDTERDIIRDGKRLGVIQLGMSIKGIKGSLEILMWRGLITGLVFLGLITASVWLLTLRLGRQLDTLLLLADNMDAETLPPQQLDPRDDTGKVSFALRELHTRLRAEQRRRAEAETQKDDFFAMTVHDLKQPLTSLKAALDLLLSEEERKSFSEAQIRGLSAIAGTSLKMLNTMVVDILNMAKMNDRDYAPEKERIPLDAFMRECAGENSASVKAAGKTWRFSVPEDIAGTWIFGDHDMIKRVVGNLVLNAIQYTPEGGAIKLGVRFVSEHKAAIYVSDEGEGIPDEFREEIFQKYRGMGKSSKNIGLGLAFCRLVADRHAAMMDVRSEIGKGTEVSFVIPASRGTAVKPHNA